MYEPEIVVLIPCYNEEKTVAKVVGDFFRHLPKATIYVYDNNSIDNTSAIAEAAGAVVRSEIRQGKGNVVRRMFADIDADVYIMVDGDDTYDAGAVPKMLDAMISDGLDIVNGVRREKTKLAYRPGHLFGNWLLTTMIQMVFGREFNDILSGLKVFSRRFVKSFPINARGFEIETELIIHALELQMPGAEYEVPYRTRPSGSESKLNTIRDGIKILRTIFDLAKQERPLFLFSIVGLVIGGLSVLLAYPIFLTYIDTGLVPRFPTAILCSALMIISFLSFSCGLILDTVTRGRQEAKRMCYLSVPGIYASMRPVSLQSCENPSSNDDSELPNS